MTGKICNCRECNGIIHEIGVGDTLYLLSRYYNVSVGEIMKENKGINPYNLMVGDKICIPKKIMPRNEESMMDTNMLKNVIEQNENASMPMNKMKCKECTENKDVYVIDNEIGNYDMEFMQDCETEKVPKKSAFDTLKEMTIEELKGFMKS